MAIKNGFVPLEKTKKKLSIKLWKYFSEEFGHILPKQAHIKGTFLGLHGQNQILSGKDFYCLVLLQLAHVFPKIT